MGGNAVAMACGSCGHRLARWAGRCPSCGAWGTIAEAPVERRSGRGGTAVAVALGGDGGDEPRLATGFDGVDRVLGGGLVPGSVVLLAGEPGIGKSTLLLQIAARAAAGGRRSLYASGEESRGQVSARARRLGLPQDATAFVSGRELPDVLGAARDLRPDLLVVDSIQAIRDPDSSSLPGGPAQVRGCGDALVGLAKATGTAVVLAGQVTKDGDVAGPRTLEHAVDVVCSFDGDLRTGLRTLSGGKNRFGPEGEVAWFEMGAAGLVEVDPAGLLAPADGEPGAAVALVAAGRRALAVEVQALASAAEGPPRRSVSGLDPRRFGLVAAVLDRVVGMGLARRELYGAAAGGLRVDDPGADLALAAAVASATSGAAPPPGSAFVGEVSLTGGVRSVPGMPFRLSAAAGAGVRTVYAPPGTGASEGLRVVPVRRLEEALRWASPRRRAAAPGRAGGPPDGAAAGLEGEARGGAFDAVST